MSIQNVVLTCILHVLDLFIPKATHSINELQSLSSLSFWGFFHPKRRIITCLLPPALLSSCTSLGWLCNTVPTSSFLLTTKTLFFFIFPPLHLSGAITPPYSAYDRGAMRGRTHWPWMIMSFRRAEIYELHFLALQLFGLVAVKPNGGE